MCLLYRDRFPLFRTFLHNWQMKYHEILVKHPMTTTCIFNPTIKFFQIFLPPGGNWTLSIDLETRKLWQCLQHFVDNPMSPYEISLPKYVLWAFSSIFELQSGRFSVKYRRIHGCTALPRWEIRFCRLLSSICLMINALSTPRGQYNVRVCSYSHRLSFERYVFNSFYGRTDSVIQIILTCDITHMSAHGKLNRPSDFRSLWSEVKDETPFRYAHAHIRIRVVQYTTN